jgi:hypothetical protein
MFGGEKKSNKQRNKEKMADVRKKGKAGEETFRRSREDLGDKVERTGRGHDFKVTHESLLTGRKSTKYVEVKTGKKAKTSKLQKETKKKLGKKYEVHRVDHPWPSLY